MNKIHPRQNPKPHSLGAKRILIWVVSVVVFLVIMSSVVELFIKYRGIRKHIAELKIDQNALEEKKKNLSLTNEYITTPEGQERVFRDKYRLVKPGEGIIIVTEPDIKEPEVKKKPAIRRFWDSIVSGLGL